MALSIAVYQFLAPSDRAEPEPSGARFTPAQRTDLSFEFALAIRRRPFEINFAQVIASRPSIGAGEYVDPEIDWYMEQRWPRCVAAEGQVNGIDSALLRDKGLLRRVVLFARKCIWARPTLARLAVIEPEHFASTVGYRREYLNRQLYDIAGNRRPSTLQTYAPTKLGDIVGPGVVTLPKIGAFDEIPNELVWSQIIPFPDRSSPDVDHDAILKRASAVKRHYNSYAELRDSRRHLENGELKAAVRSAASAVDAILRYYCVLWEVRFPGGQLPFDEKIERVLAGAGRSSFRNTNEPRLRDLLYLYRARNSMHEGDCYYLDVTGARVKVNRRSQVATFVGAVEFFVMWIDSLA